MGLQLARGIVATDYNVIPMGTRKDMGRPLPPIRAMPLRETGDLYFDSREEAMSWGIKTVNVTIL